MEEEKELRWSRKRRWKWRRKRSEEMSHLRGEVVGKGGIGRVREEEKKFDRFC